MMDYFYLPIMLHITFHEHMSCSKRGPCILHSIHHMLYVVLHIIGAVTRRHVAGECTTSGVPPVHMNHSETGAS